MAGPPRKLVRSLEWVLLGGVPALRGTSGRLGMTFLPGKRYPGRGGDHWRELEADAAVLRDVHGVDTLLLLVEDLELDAAPGWCTPLPRGGRYRCFPEERLLAEGPAPD